MQRMIYSISYSSGTSFSFFLPCLSPVLSVFLPTRICFVSNYFKSTKCAHSHPNQIKIKPTEFCKSLPLLLKEKSWRLSKMKFNKGVFKVECKDALDKITAHIWAQSHLQHTLGSQLPACRRVDIRCCVVALHLSSKTYTLALLYMH